MQILALQTDIERVKQLLLVEGETEILTIHYHGFQFLQRICFLIAAIIAFILLSGLLVSVGVTPDSLVTIAFATLWTLIAAVWVVNAYIDWRFDFLFITDRKFVKVNQSFLFRRNAVIIPFQTLQLVTAQTQWGDLFGFGRLILKATPPAPEIIVLSYIADAQSVAAKLSEFIMKKRKKEE